MARGAGLRDRGGSPTWEARVPRRLRVVVVDDSAVLRDLLVAYLEDEPDLEVVRTFADTATLVAAVADVDPDVIVLDNQMPGGDGVEALPELRRRCPRARIVLWSSDLEVAARALAGGADRFVGKDTPFGAVVDAATSAA